MIENYLSEDFEEEGEVFRLSSALASKRGG